MYDIVTEDLNNGYKLLVCTDGDQPYSVLAHLSVFVIVNILHIDCLLRDYLDIWNQTLQERCLWGRKAKFCLDLTTTCLLRAFLCSDCLISKNFLLNYWYKNFPFQLDPT